MKKYYVYEIVNLMGTVEYVGETTMPKRRFYSHTKIAPKKGLGAGKFYNRSDVFMNIVSEFSNRKDAWYHQCELQSEYGFVTDKMKLLKNKGNTFGVVKPIIAFNKNGKFIAEYKSVTEASNILGLKGPEISMVLNQTRKHCKGYTFQFKIVK